jgi:hypothetical protein
MSNLVKYQEQKQKLDYYHTLASNAMKSGCYEGMKLETLVNLMLSAADLGVSPMKAINGAFHIIKGKISMAGHLISDRIRKAGHSIKVIEHTRDKCIIIGVRKDNGDSYKSEYDLDDAKLAGLLSPNNKNWANYPKDMLYNRAIARLGRVLFSDVVGACYSEDERHDIEGTALKDRPLDDPDEADTIHLQPIDLPEEANQSSLQTLKDLLENEGIETQSLESYLGGLAEKKGQTVDHILNVATTEKFFPKFKAAYTKELASRPTESTA